MKPAGKSQTMFHISRHYLGQMATFKPRIPVSQNKCEIDLPARVCAGPTVEQCWEAINGFNDLITEMKKNNVTGYYFFVYKFNDVSTFVPSATVKDYNNSGEMISALPVNAELVEVFYVDSWRLYSSLEKAKEPATFEEAIKAYNNWQGEDLMKIEQIVNAMPWPL